MPFVIFYSWQSDRDPRTTRHFIREAIDLAVKKLNRGMEVEDCLRVDQDTQGIPGHPEIFRTICGKIDDCTIFVADLTYVGATDTGENIPNPNVAIELGYALKSIGPDRYIAVMNSAYGGPEFLPFDLQHRRWPIQYGLSMEATAEERSKQRNEFVNKLAEAIRTIIESGVLDSSSTPEPEEKPFRISSLSDPELVRITQHYKQQGEEATLPLMEDRDVRLAKGYRKAYYPGTRREVWAGLSNGRFEHILMLRPK